MTLTTRLLPPAEWPRLQGTELETVYPHLDHTQADIVVVEDEGVIVGCWALLTVRHAEGLWVSPTTRGRESVKRRLLLAFYKRCKELHIRTVATAAMTTEIEDLLAHVDAQPLPGKHYVMSVER